RLRRLERRVRDARREMYRLADGVLGEERLVCREELLYDVAVDLLALEVPHLLVAAEMRERVIRLAHLVLCGERRALREERHGDVVRMLRAHASWDTFGRPERRRGRGGRPFFHRKTLGKQQLRFNAERPLRKTLRGPNSQLFLKTPTSPAGIHVGNESQFPHPPSYPCKDGAGSRHKALRSRPRLGTQAGWSPHDVRRLPRVVRVREREPLCDE